MTEEQIHSGLVWTVFLIAVVSFASLLVLAAPYGRHYSGKGWGPHISNRASWVLSCPNYLGEIVERAGWALATWAPASLAFFVYTAANLIPRARSHHQWYRKRFPEYPASWKALIPGLI